MSVWNETVQVSKCLRSPLCSRPAGVRGLLEDGVQRGEPAILAGLWGLQEGSQRDGKGRGCQKDLRGVCRSRRAQTGTAFVKRKWELCSSWIHLNCSLSRSLLHSCTRLLYRNTASALLFLWRSFVHSFSLLLFEHAVNFLRYDNVRRQKK